MLYFYLNNIFKKILFLIKLQKKILTFHEHTNREEWTTRHQRHHQYHRHKRTLRDVSSVQIKFVHL